MITSKSVSSCARRWVFGSAGLVLIGAGACTSEVLEEDEAVLDTSAEAFTAIGTTFSAGMRMTFDKMNASGFPDMKEAVGLTACDYRSLYMVRGLADGTFTLYFSNNSGETFKNVGNAAGPHIACDHTQLLSLDPYANNALRMARTHLDGTISPWSGASQANKVDRIQGGDGTFYGVKLGQAPITNHVLTATNMAHPTNDVPSWGSTIATIGAVSVTGLGAKSTGDGQTDIDLKAWPRRAFALQQDGRVLYNDLLLSGSNSWTSLDFGTERYFALSAAATHDPKNQPNALFGLQRRNGTVELNRVRMAEVECHDGIDNDRNGLTDGEDWSCEQTFANEFCANKSNGNYCIARGAANWARGIANFNPSLVTCSLGSSTAVKPGACILGGALGQDTLPAFSSSSMIIPEPSGYGHWCNARASDGTSKLSWTGSDPCAALIAEGRTVVRAGLYSLQGKNNVMANCNGRNFVHWGPGTVPLVAVKNDVGTGTDTCIINVSPDALPVFSRMFDLAHQTSQGKPNGFVHNLELSGPDINRFGVACSDEQGKCIGEGAYDNGLNEGRPLYAVGPGRVMINGSRDADVTAVGKSVGSSNQGEIFVEYAVSSGSYQEQFVVYYAHLRKRLVQSGQTVRAGQLLGYVGATGNTGGWNHVHTAVFRLSNNNAYTANNPALGWHMSGWFGIGLTPDTFMGYETSIDVLGWAGPGIDPWANERRNDLVRNLVDPGGERIRGVGAWSIALFKPDQAFAYPLVP